MAARKPPKYIEWPPMPAESEPVAVPSAPPPPATDATPTTPATPATPAPPATDPTVPDLASLPSLSGTVHQIAASGDFLYGQGYVTMPFNFSLNLAPGLGQFTPAVDDSPRKSSYIGTTLSYSYNQKWFWDFSYRKGSSSGDTEVPLLPGFTLPSQFTISDNWYQLAVRYEMMRGKRLRPYLKIGVSYVMSDLKVNSNEQGEENGLDLYQQKDQTKDILGNLGFGAVYWLKTGKFKVGVQFEGEGFFGSRSQESLESLPGIMGPDYGWVTANISNTIYGGVARGTMRFDYSLIKSELFRVYADVGAQANFTQVRYSSVGGAYNELLWGPFVKLGFKYSF